MDIEMDTKRSSSPSDQNVETTSTKPSKYRKYIGCKDFTLKDGIEMLFTLLVPAMIGILAIILQKNDIDLTQKNRENDLYISRLQRQSDDEQTQALGNETVFSNYVKNMIDVILNYKSDGENSPQYNITRVLTNTALRQLNFEKKKLVVQFLYDVEFLKRGSYIFYIDEPYEDIKNLKGAILDQIDFSGGLELSRIVLRSVTLINASFVDSDFEGADFTNSKLIDANFSQTKLNGARFIDTQLQRTNFQGASLETAQFIRANLTQSTITDDQLAQALAVFNTILPNGTYARNKTYLINGDAKQGINGWNITSGIIQVKDFYFTGQNNATMVQRIGASIARSYGSIEVFDYCLSFLFHGQEKLSIEIDSYDQNRKKIGVENFREITSSSCDKNSSNSLDYCYWSSCNHTIVTTDSLDLKFIFGDNNDTTNIIAVKNIEFTIFVE